MRSFWRAVEVLIWLGLVFTTSACGDDWITLDMTIPQPPALRCPVPLPTHPPFLLCDTVWVASPARANPYPRP